MKVMELATPAGPSHTPADAGSFLRCADAESGRIVADRSDPELPHTAYWCAPRPRKSDVRRALLVSVGLLTQTDDRFIPTPHLLALRSLPLESFVEALFFFILTEQRELWLGQLAVAEEVPWEFVPRQRGCSSSFDIRTPGTAGSLRSRSRAQG